MSFYWFCHAVAHFRYNNGVQRLLFRSQKSMSEDDLYFETFYHRSGKQYQCIYEGGMRFYQDRSMVSHLFGNPRVGYSDFCLLHRLKMFIYYYYYCCCNFSFLSLMDIAHSVQKSALATTSKFSFLRKLKNYGVSYTSH